MNRITIEDVAKAAGVSRQTVSRAINDKGEISPETKVKVMQAVEELGYRPNRMAQSMVTQRTHMVGVLLADITNPYFPEVTRGIQDVAQANGYNVFVCNTDDQAKVELQEMRSLAAQGVDGIIDISYNMSDEDLRSFADTYHPLVLFNRFFDHPNVSCLIVDHFYGAQLAADHFIRTQRLKIGALTHGGDNYLLSRRILGFKQRILEHEIAFLDEHVIPTAAKATLDGGYQAANQLLDRYPETNAIFTYNDIMAIGAVRACLERGYRIPDDVAIIGFDDIQFSRMITPSLTTIRVDKYAIGQMAIHRLLEMIENPDESFPRIDIEPELILRETA